MLARILAILPGLAMSANTVLWIIDPKATAESLGMPLLDGLGRSTQIGDFTAFFFTAALMCFLGAWRQHVIWLLGAALLLGSAAIFRLTAWSLHGAELATAFIGFEVVAALLLITSAALMRRNSA